MNAKRRGVCRYRRRRRKGASLRSRAFPRALALAGRPVGERRGLREPQRETVRPLFWQPRSYDHPTLEFDGSKPAPLTTWRAPPA